MKLRDLQSQSTLRLVVLTIVTYAVYPVYYLRRLTNLINLELDQNRRVSSVFVSANFIFAYLSLVLFIPYLVVDDGHPVAAISNLVDAVSAILILIWAFKMRNRLNALLTSTPGELSWFRGFWTFLLGDVYINYKINVLCDITPEQDIGQVSPEDAPSAAPDELSM